MLRRLGLALTMVGAGMVTAGEPIGFGRDTSTSVADPENATTVQLAQFLWGSLYTDDALIVPPALKSRVGELSSMATDLDPNKRVHGAFALAVLGRGDALTRTAFAPVVGSPPFEKANAAFLACAVQGSCPAAVKRLRELALVPAKKSKPKRIENLEAVLLLSLIQQQGFAAFVDALPTQDPVQLEAIAVAKRRHEVTFPSAR